MFEVSNSYYFLSLTNIMLKFLKGRQMILEPNLLFSIKYIKFVENIYSFIAITLHIAWTPLKGRASHKWAKVGLSYLWNQGKKCWRPWAHSLPVPGSSLFLQWPCSGTIHVDTQPESLTRPLPTVSELCLGHPLGPKAPKDASGEETPLKP